MELKEILEDLLESEIEVKKIIPLGRIAQKIKKGIFNRYGEILLLEEYKYLDEEPEKLKIQKGKINYDYLIEIEYKQNQDCFKVNNFYVVVKNLEELIKLKDLDLVMEAEEEIVPWSEKLADKLVLGRKIAPKTKVTIIKEVIIGILIGFMSIFILFLVSIIYWEDRFS